MFLFFFSFTENKSKLSELLAGNVLNFF